MKLVMLKLEPLSKAYWTRVLLAILTAFICVALGMSGARGIIFGFIMYIASYYIVRYGLDVDPAEVGGSGKLFTTGIGSFFILWIMLWTLLHTIMMSPLS